MAAALCSETLEFFALSPFCQANRPTAYLVLAKAPKNRRWPLLPCHSLLVSSSVIISLAIETAQPNPEHVAVLNDTCSVQEPRQLRGGCEAEVTGSRQVWPIGNLHCIETLTVRSISRDLLQTHIGKSPDLFPSMTQGPFQELSLSFCWRSLWIVPAQDLLECLQCPAHWRLTESILLVLDYNESIVLPVIRRFLFSLCFSTFCPVQGETFDFWWTLWCTLPRALKHRGNICVFFLASCCVKPKAYKFTYFFVSTAARRAENADIVQTCTCWN